MKPGGDAENRMPSGRRRQALISLPLVLLILTGVLSFLAASCALPAAEPSPPADQNLPNPVIPDADLITIGIPASNSTVSTTPDFSWTATTKGLVYLAVFSANIQVAGGGIANPQDIVWAWNTGLKTGREGSVKFTDGRSVVNGRMVLDSPPQPLVSGKNYVWAVWAWDDAGYAVVKASPETYFTTQ